MGLTIVLMGVSGCGKTSVGQALSDKLGWAFYDEDDYHSPSEVEKMSKGIPLNDEDRMAWLKILSDLITSKHQTGENLVLACSALKKKYRQILKNGNPGLIFVVLEGQFNLIWNRMKTRREHFMKAEMLKSQFDIFEIPTNALRVNIDQSVDAIVEKIIEFLKLEHKIDLDHQGELHCFNFPAIHLPGVRLQVNQEGLNYREQPPQKWSF